MFRFYIFTSVLTHFWKQCPLLSYSPVICSLFTRLASFFKCIELHREADDSWVWKLFKLTSCTNSSKNQYIHFDCRKYCAHSSHLLTSLYWQIIQCSSFNVKVGTFIFLLSFSSFTSRRVIGFCTNDLHRTFRKFRFKSPSPQQWHSLAVI